MLDAVGGPDAPVLGLDPVVVDPQFEALGILQLIADRGRPQIGLLLSFAGERLPLEASASAFGEGNALLFG